MSNAPFRQAPFFRLLLPFVGGILLGLRFNNLLNSDQLNIILLAFLALSFCSLLIQLKWHLRWLSGFLFFAFLFVAGLKITSNNFFPSKIPERGNSESIIRLIEPPEIRVTSTRALALVESMLLEGVWVDVNEKVLVYFSASDSAAVNLEYGTRLAVKTVFASPPAAQNPYQFDQREYLANKQIHRVAFIQKEGWMYIGEKKSKILSAAFNLRGTLISTYQKAGIENQNLAVLSALTLGYKGLLDDEIRRVYSASGAMHILAVSGLHVGILFFIISGLLFFLNRIKHGKRVKALAVILFLWFFALFTGMSPSVMRASLMFSLVIIGVALSHRTSIYNTLSGSAFVLLCYNPLLITDIGFQLSFLAVTSIVFFYPYIYKLVYIKHKWLDMVWSLVAVSIAAQLGTFAISLYYFQQFPNYFLLTNLFAIPLATAVLYLAVGIIVFSPIELAANILGWFLGKTLSLLNYLVTFTESIPYSTTTGIGITGSQTIFLVISIVFFAIFLEKRKALFLIGFMSCMLIFFAENLSVKLKQAAQQEIVIFQTKGTTTIGFTFGKTITFASSDTTNQNPWEKHAFGLKGYVNKMGVTPKDDVIWLSQIKSTPASYNMVSCKANQFGTLFHFAEKTIFIPRDDSFEIIGFSNILTVDILLLTGDMKSFIKEPIAFLDPKIVVIDSTVPKWQAQRISKMLNIKGIKIHTVENDGAYRLSV